MRVEDEAGNPEINRENQRRQQALLERVADMDFPHNPMDALVSHFGVSEVAEVSGRTHLCRLDPGPLASAHEWLNFYERFWNSRLDVLEQLLRAEDASKTKKPKSKKSASKSRSGKGDK